MTQDELIIKANRYLLIIRRKLFSVIDELPYEEGVFDERHIMIITRKILDDPESSIVSIIKRMKIADYTRNDWTPDKEQGDLKLTQEQIDFNESVKDA